MKWWIFLFVLTAFFLFGCINTKSFPIKGYGLSVCEEEETYVVPEAKTFNVPYTVKEPQVTTQPYQVQEPYTTQDCGQQPYSYSASIECSNDWFSGVYVPITYKATVKLTNNENSDGTFSVLLRFRTVEGENIDNTVTQNVNSKITRDFSYSISRYNKQGALDGHCYYEVVNVPTLYKCTQQTQYRTVTHYRDVTNYIDVTKTREETRIVNVTKTRTNEVPC